MMNVPGYETSPAYTAGENVSLPAGKYVCRIEKAEPVSMSGWNALELHFDICEGEYTDFFKKKYDRDQRYNGRNAKWGCVFRQGYEGASLPFFKGVITAIEKSNTGYRWNGDEQKLVGLRVGVLFGREQFVTRDGELAWAVKPRFIRSIDALQSASVPEDKPVKQSATNTLTEQGFTNFDDNVDDLPF